MRIQISGLIVGGKNYSSMNMYNASMKKEPMGDQFKYIWKSTCQLKHQSETYIAKLAHDLMPRETQGNFLDFEMRAQST
jgi:hypothetical protein